MQATCYAGAFAPLMLRPYLDLPRRVQLLCFGAFVQRAGAFIIPFLAMDLADRRGLGEAFATLAIGVFGAGLFVASLIGGALADRFGRRPIMLVSLFGAAASCLALVDLESRAAILVGVFGFALIHNLFGPASSAMLADVTEEGARPHAYALMYTAANLGFAVGATIGGQIAGRSFFWLFGGEAITTALFGLLVLALIPESRPPVSATTPRGRGINLAFLSDRPFLAMLTASFLIGLLFQQSFSTLPLVMTHAGLSPQTYGGVMALNGVMIAVIQLPVATVLAVRRMTPSLTIASLLIGGGFGLTAAASGGMGYAGAIAVWTLGEIVLWSLNQAAVAKMAPVDLRGSYFGAFTATFGLSMIVGPIAGGFVHERAGAVVLWGGCAVIGTVAAMIFATLGERIDGKYLQSSPSPR